MTPYCQHEARIEYFTRKYILLSLEVEYYRRRKIEIWCFNLINMKVRSGLISKVRCIFQLRVDILIMRFLWGLGWVKDVEGIIECDLGHCIKVWYSRNMFTRNWKYETSLFYKYGLVYAIKTQTRFKARWFFKTPWS